MNSTANAVEQLVSLSRAILARNAVPSFFLIPLGALGIAANTLIVIVLFRSRLYAKSNHYFCMLNLAVSDLLVCLVYICLGLKRTILYMSGGNDVSTPLRCAVDQMASGVTLQWTMLNMVAMGIDRLLGVSIPMRYKLMDVSRLHLMCLCAWLLPVGLVVVSAFGVVTPPLIPACLYGVEFDVWWQSLETYLDCAFGVIIVFIYVSLVAALWIHQKQAAKSGSSISEISKALHVRVAKTALVIGAVCIVTFVLPQWIQALLTTVPGGEEILPYYGPWYLVVTLLSPVLNLPLYLWKNEQFREKFMAMKNTVAEKLWKSHRTNGVMPVGGGVNVL